MSRSPILLKLSSSWGGQLGRYFPLDVLTCLKSWSFVAFGTVDEEFAIQRSKKIERQPSHSPSEFLEWHRAVRVAWMNVWSWKFPNLTYSQSFPLCSLLYVLLHLVEDRPFPQSKQPLVFCVCPTQQLMNLNGNCALEVPCSSCRSATGRPDISCRFHLLALLLSIDRTDLRTAFLAANVASNPRL